MCTLDAPIARCEAAHTMVLLDETQVECACEHGCPPGRNCPLQGCFAKLSGLYEPHPELKAVTAAPMTLH
ncbi:hypothetical protein [Thauera sp.]|uniref:hypothetical protein n=1 Tax=Thauera sp. TaxID=1905334 RepID=UPI002CFFA11E|nr:hypothetical protein [Thauera sp.]HRP22946.1 hypothetical protein [Thauera sp.]